MNPRCLSYLLLSLLAVPSLFAQSLNIDLGDYFGAPSSAYGAAAGQPGTWAQLTGNDAGVVTLNLPGLNGVPTAVDATVYSGPDDGWDTGCAGDALAFFGDDVYDTGGDNWAVNLTSLANGDYQLYLYAPYNALVPTGSITVNGIGVGSLEGHGCTPVLGSTYMTVNVTVTDGTLSISGSGQDYAGLAGLQLVAAAPAVPVPFSPVTLATMAVLLAACALVALQKL